MSDDSNLIDNIIDIASELKKIKSPIDSLGDMFDEKVNTSSEKVTKFVKPTANPSLCLACKAGSQSACKRCIDICPSDAIEIRKDNIFIKDSCTGCGLCLEECLTEALFSFKQTDKDIANQIRVKARMYEKCYITCPFAVSNKHDNMVVVSCIGAIPKEILSTLLFSYPNLEIYLPQGVCERCSYNTAEAIYMKNIEEAEKVANRFMGLECESSHLNLELKRTYKRKQFLDSLTNNLSKTNGLDDSDAIIKQSESEIGELVGMLDEMSADPIHSQNIKHLTQRRQIALNEAINSQDYATRYTFDIPKVNPELCTSCSLCSEVCSVGALEIDEYQVFSLEPTYCVGCGACAKVCETKAITMVRMSADMLDDISSLRQMRQKELLMRNKQKQVQQEEAKRKISESLAKFEEISDEL